MQKKICFLRNVDIYKGISEQELITATKDAVELWVEKDAIIFEPQNPCNSIYVIKDGEIELFQMIEKNGKEKKVVIETLFPGDVFGNFGVESGKLIAIATRKSYVCKTPTSEFLDIVKTHPEIIFKLMQSLAEKTRTYENKIAELQKPAKKRLLGEIKNLYHKNKKRILGKIFSLPFKISHQQLADKTGLNRVTVTKLIQSLKEEKKIQVDPTSGAIEVV